MLINSKNSPAVSIAAPFSESSPFSLPSERYEWKTVSVVDPDVSRRASICYELSRNDIHGDPFETIGEFTDRQPKTGIVILHDAENAISSLIDALARQHSWLPLIAFSESPEPARIVDAVLAGAVGYTAWPAPSDVLISALRIASTRMSPSLGSRRAFALRRIEKLSQRERAILASITEGLNNREIGIKLNISPRTVELHRANLLNKIGARNSADGIRMAMEAGLAIFPPPLPDNK